MGFQQPMLMPGNFPHYPPPPYSMSQTLQPSHAVAIPLTHQASAPAAEASLPSSPAEPASPAPGSLSFRQLEARVDTLFSIANSASDVVVACRGDIDETQHWIGPMNASFPTLSSESLIGKWFVINIWSIFIPSAATHLTNSAFFKAGIFVLQLNLLCCPCFARTPMQ